jgi:preprotein translocase SecF subunit
MRFFGKTHLDFVSRRRTAFLFSAVVIGAGLISLLIKGGPDLSIDFEGGVIIQLKFQERAATEEIRGALDDAGYPNSEIQTFRTGNEVLIRAPLVEGKDVTEDIKSAVAGRLADNPFEVRREELVGPKVGRELGKNAIWAIVIGLGAILVYVAFRFEFRFAVAAVAALFHDVLVTLGIFSLTGKEVSLAVVAAFLTIVGYSLNDTIVVFDRIREDLRKYHREHYEGVINASINETLSRTIMTSLTTLIVVLFLFFLGGEVLRDFAFALLVGVIVGTYSSIFVASPILVEWYRKSPQRRR